VEVWTRFMKAAHQGVAVASLPYSQTGNAFSNLAQAASQVSAPNPSGPLAPIPPGVVNRPAPTRASVRPEAAGGLDGWLIQRLFGR
jgi:penicillin-binding protein 1A